MIDQARSVAAAFNARLDASKPLQSPAL